MNNTTIVTGIWDINREQLSQGWSRSFVHYLNNLAKLMKCENDMIIFIEEKYKSFIESNRKKENTLIIIRELEWFKSNTDIFNKIQNIRNNSDWYSQAEWLKESTQARLEMYNPIVMSKMFLLNDAAIFDPFNSTHLVWIDGALTNTVHEGYFWHDKVVNKLDKYFNMFSFVAFPYDGKNEIHGFTYTPMCEYAGGQVDKVCRGGIFGGPKKSIKKANELYYSLLLDTLSNGYMGTEESLFTILLYKYPVLFQYYEIELNGLLGKFFEELKNDTVKAKQQLSVSEDIALYVLTYNSPKQFQTLCISFEQYDKNFLEKPKKYLLNNSLDHGLDAEYAALCTQYGFEEIKKDNIGICGGRQFIAEHADQHNFSHYLFFEDDMFFYNGKDDYCKNGFQRKIPGLYNKILDITTKEQFDFLKLNFTEFFGDNSKQWSWHNVPQTVREELFPEKPRKSENDTGKEPFLKFKNIKSLNGLPYATGEVYYCNWPQVVSREGNKKMFIETKWAHPFEQTWMSYMYQETLKSKIYPGILLATPTEHNRFEFYNGKERREN